MHICEAKCTCGEATFLMENIKLRGNVFKIIFIILIILLMIVAVYMNFFKISTTNKTSPKGQLNKGNTIVSNNIRIAIISFDNMNPILSNNKNVQDVSRLIFDSLFTLTQDYRLEESLAKEWSKLNSTTYLIKLREDIKWQDGNQFDATDVIFTIDMIKKKENNSIYSYNVADISSVQKIDEYTLKIITKKEIPYFEYNLIFPIVSSKYYNEKNLKPVGTGLFYVSDMENNSILLKKNVSGWHNQNMKLDSITLNLYDSLSSAINSFKHGEIDIFTTSNTRIEEYLKNINYSKQEYINRNYAYITLNCSNKLLKNIEVRQAINYAINKEELIKDIYNAKYAVSNFPLDFGSFAYDKNNASIVYEQNTAKKLLVDNKWKYSSKKWRKIVDYRYLTIDLNLVVNKTNSDMLKLANKIKDQLESIGIRITVVKAAQSKYNSYIKNKNYDIILCSGTYGYSPSLNKYFQSENLANYSNKELDNILQKSKQITDPNELAQEYTKIVNIYNSDVPYISLYYNTNTMVYSSNLKGNIIPNSYNLFYNIENWYREYKK